VKASPPVLYRNAQEEVGDDKFCIPIVNICILKTPTQEVQDGYGVWPKGPADQEECHFKLPIVNICVIPALQDLFSAIQDQDPAVQEECHFKLPIVNICVIPALEEDDQGRKCLTIGEGEACLSDDVSDLSVTDGQGNQGCFMKLGHLCVGMPTVMDEFPAVEEEKECKLKIASICINWIVQEELDEDYHLTINGHGVWPKGPADQEECHFKIPIVGICVIPAHQDLFSAVQDQDPAVQEDCHFKIPFVGICVIPALEEDEQGRKCLRVGTGRVCVSDDVTDLSVSDDYLDNSISDTYGGQDELGCFIEFGQLCVEMPTVMDEFPAIEEKKECKIKILDVCIQWRIQEDMDDECNLRINDYCTWTKYLAIQ